MTSENNDEFINLKNGKIKINQENPKMMISDEELAKERIPLNSRDYCAHLLVSLNRCKRKNFYLPFRCTEEKHEYEHCQYKDFLRRSKIYKDQKSKETEN